MFEFCHFSLLAVLPVPLGPQLRAKSLRSGSESQSWEDVETTTALVPVLGSISA